MRNRLFFVAIFTLLFTNSSFAQLVGGNGFLQGAWLEIGECTVGALGTGSSPSNYHSHIGFGGTYVPGQSLAEVYDYGHDGWSIGTPPLMGDYTYPGSPFEGWELQFNSGRAQAYYTSGFPYGTSWAYSGGATSTGGLTGYSNIAGVKKLFWNGTVTIGGATVAVSQETRVDTFADAVVFTVTMKNTSGTNANNVYYWRSCDPDNDETWPTGGFPTDNVVDWQNATLPNPTHKVSVTAYGNSTTHPPLTLCTKDCRAVACIYNYWGLSVTQDLAAVYNQTYSPASYAVGVHDPGDIAIGLVYHLPNLLPGDSVIIAYSYVFNGPSGIDGVGALPDPALSINGSGPIMSFPDTFDMCTLPTGVDTVPVDILYGSDKDWSWSKWTWTPSTGLSATTGTHVIVGGSLLSGITTYTVTGTDSAYGMSSCNTKTFVFTIKPCHYAHSNNPCLGDPIHLTMTGDSTGATYYWWGPNGFTSTQHSPVISPSVWADSGTYYVVKTVAGTHDTDYTHVLIHPLPVVNLTSNQVNCTQLVTPLNLFCSLDSVGETFSWSGPFGFTSTLQNPTINPFDSSLQGTYVCTGTTIWGCKSTSTLDIWAGVTLGYYPAIHYGCNFDTVYFIDTTHNANVYQWDYRDGTPADHNRDGFHIYNAHQFDSVTLTVSNPHCPASKLTKAVDLRHDIHAAFLPSPDTICFSAFGTGMQIMMRDSSYADDSGFFNLPPNTYSWTFGDGTIDNSATPNKTYAAPGAYSVKLVVTDAMGCPDSESMSVYVVQLGITSVNDTTLCISQPLELRSVLTSIPTGFTDGAAFLWTQSAPNLDALTIQHPHTSGFGSFGDTLMVTIPGVVPDGCPIYDTITINSIQGAAVGNVTASQTIAYGNSIQLNATGQVWYRWLPNDGTLDNNNINNPVATPTHTETYTVFGLDVNGCLDSAYVTVYVDTTAIDGVPAAFSPNNDGLNDKFKPVGVKFQHMVEMRIYNRWGQELFATNSNEDGWDGTYHGVPQDIGTYYYMIVLAEPGGQNKVYKGNFTLVR